MTITITHPGARLLAPALEILADVVAGDWATVARLCAGRLTDPHRCGVDLGLAAERAGVTRSRRQAYRYRVHPGLLVVHEAPVLLSAALDLHMKMWMGQWEALDQVALPTQQPLEEWGPHELLRIRRLHQRFDTWSARPDTSPSLFLVPMTARLAYHVLAKLDAGTALDPEDVPAGPATVHVG